jgi:hypothetical protein
MWLLVAKAGEQVLSKRRKILVELSGAETCSSLVSNTLATH